MTLYCGNNLAVLRRHVADASVDLVYLDPPFQLGRRAIGFDLRAEAVEDANDAIAARLPFGGPT